MSAFDRSDRTQTAPDTRGRHLARALGPMLRVLLGTVLAASVLASAGCSGQGGSGTGGPATSEDDDEAPLSSYEALFAGVPSNAELPDENKADAVYPAVYDELVALQSPVRSQGSRGVCSIFATVGLMEHLYIKAGMPNPDFSEQYLQWSVKVEAGGFPNTEGSSNYYNLRAISQFGIPEESAWPYESFPWDGTHDPECADPPEPADGGTAEEVSKPTRCYTNGDPPESARTAMKYKLPQGRYVNTNSIKAHMYGKKTAVAIGVDFFYQSWNHRKSVLPRNLDYWDMGYVLYPNGKDKEESRKQRAGHAVVLVGWDDNLEVPIVDAEGKQVIGPDGKPVTEKGFYIFKNSWGTSGFGIRNPYGPGYGYISMRYVAEEANAYVSDVPTIEQPSVLPDGGVPTDGGEGAGRYENATVTEIPDNDPAGIASEIVVPDEGTITSLRVNVDITHSYVGDLTVRLVKDGTTVVLQERKGGPDDNLVKTFTPTELIGLERSGTWRLEVADSARIDTGRLNRWSLEIQ